MHEEKRELTNDARLEAILFYQSGPVKRKELLRILKIDEEELNEGIEILEENLRERGIRIVEHEGEIRLGTAPEISSLIEEITKDELMKDLGKAGLETLSIILYKGPVSRRDIDNVRGVNSSFILRNLLIRGLIDREESKEGRGYAYRPSLDLLMHLGITSLEELPDYKEIKLELENFGKSEDNGEQNG